MSRAHLEKPNPITIQYSVLENNPTGKILVKNDVEELEGGTDWKVRATNQDGWKARYMMGWSLRSLILLPPKKCILLITNLNMLDRIKFIRSFMTIRCSKFKGFINLWRVRNISCGLWSFY